MDGLLGASILVEAGVLLQGDLVGLLHVLRDTHPRPREGLHADLTPKVGCVYTKKNRKKTDHKKTISFFKPNLEQFSFNLSLFWFLLKNEPTVPVFLDIDPRPTKLSEVGEFVHHMCVL